MNTWKQHFPQAEIHTGEPLVPEPIVFDVELAVEKLQRHKSAGISHFPLELYKHVLQHCGLRSTNLFILFVIKKNESNIAHIYKKGDERDCGNYRGILFLSNKYSFLSNILHSNLAPYTEEAIEDHQCGFQLSR